MSKPLGPILIHHLIYQVAIGGSRFCLVHSKTDIFTRIDGKNTLATAWCQNIDATTTTTTLTTGEWENGVELNRAIVESVQKLWQPTISTIMMKTLFKGFSFIFVQCGNKQRRYFFLYIAWQGMRAADEHQSPALPDFHLSQLRQLRPFRAGKLLQGRVPVAELLWHTEFLFVTIKMQILVFRSAH